MSYEEYAKIRDRLGLKDAKVAELSNCGKSTFSDWKSGRSVPKDEKLQRIADVLGVSTYELRTGRPLYMSALIPEEERNKLAEYYKETQKNQVKTREALLLYKKIMSIDLPTRNVILNMIDTYYKDDNNENN